MKIVKKFLKMILPRKILNKLINIYSNHVKKKINSSFEPILSELRNTKNNKRIILIGTAVYGNIGDHAISIAERTFFEKEFPDISLIEIPISLYEFKAKIINDNINNTDLIIINGGGYLGTLWKTGQDIANSIIINNPNNKIIIFPQTMYYSDGSNQLIQKHKKIISNHSNVSLIVRDKKSYDFVLREEFKFKNVILTPDIVSYIDGNKYKNPKGKVVFVLRRDHEKVDYQKDIEKLKKHFYELGYDDSDFVYTDSVVDGYYNLYNRNSVVDDYLKRIGQADFIVSDRLHGMILAAICGIPVIALDNVSNKVYGAYEWLSVFPYVLFFKDKELLRKIENIKKSDIEYSYVPEEFKVYHNAIRDLVNKEYNDF